jgi:hypothetical protein
MKYRPTFLNIASVSLIVIDNVIYWSDYLKGKTYEYGSVALMLTFAVGFFGLFTDFLLQKLVKKYWLINLIGLVVIAVFTVILLV